jgi:23S rRNA (guanine745-N1)-methyltransferase
MTSSRVRLRCTVRGCEQELHLDGASWSCAAGHSFDRARSGYVNLLQPTDRRSKQPGDSPQAVEARYRLEQAGIGVEVREELARLVRGLEAAPGEAMLDVGAGTGVHLAHVCAATGLEGWALDLSTRGCDLGARSRPGLHWVVANGDRPLPFLAGAFRLLLSSLGPKQPPEFRRVLQPGGELLLVIPAADDLIELRAAVQGEGRLLERRAAAEAHFEPWFALEETAAARVRRTLTRPQHEDVLATTYRGRHPRERERFTGVDGLEVTFAVEILRLRARQETPSG